jgi:hypothetical protein
MCSTTCAMTILGVGVEMAPPDRSDVPRNPEVLTEADIAEDSRLRHNAERLVSWVEWLLQPEEHAYDRTVFHPDGRKQEEPGPVASVNDQPGTLPSDAQLPFESVIEGYQPWQFLHGMAAVAAPQVERPSSPLAQHAAVLRNVWWVGDRGIPSLVDRFPTIGWKGEASSAAFTFLLRLQTVSGQVNKLVGVLYGAVPKYAVIIKGVRDSLDEAAAGLVKAFEDKFSSRSKNGSSIEFDVAIFAGIAAGAVALATGAGFVLPAATSLWSTLFSQATSDLLKAGKASVAGVGWRDLVESYMHKQAQILTEARQEIDQLNQMVEGQLALFNEDEEILSFLRDYAS